MPTVNDFLAQFEIPIDADAQHHGVLGMKWGKHLFGKDRASGPRDPNFKPGTHPDHRKAHTLEKKPVHQLSNNDIQKVTARLNMEKKLSSLKSEKSTFNKGHSYVKTALAVVGTATAATALVIKAVNSKPGQALIKKGAIYLRAAHVASL